MTGLGIEPSCRHFMRASMVVLWGLEVMRPRAMQADVRTFQKTSLSISANLLYIFLF
jgi:hypothetical protein